MKTHPWLRLVPALFLSSLPLGCETSQQAPPTPQVLMPAAAGLTLGSSDPCDDERPICAGNRAPHVVNVAEFAMDTLEVTRLQYATCVGQKACKGAGPGSEYTFDTRNLPALVNSPDAA